MKEKKFHRKNSSRERSSCDVRCESSCNVRSRGTKGEERKFHRSESSMDFSLSETKVQRNEKSVIRSANPNRSPFCLSVISVGLTLPCTIFYDFLLRSHCKYVTMALSGILSEIKRDIGRKSGFFILPSVTGLWPAQSVAKGMSSFATDLSCLCEIFSFFFLLHNNPMDERLRIYI